MKKQKIWNILSPNKDISSTNIIDTLLANRNITTKKDKDTFFHTSIEAITPQSLGIDIQSLEKALTRIKEAIAKKETIIVFGDYDVDGITATAILWESLNALGATVVPYIPHRIEEGYGLSVKGVENVLEKEKNTTLIITVDNGIVANEAVAFANKKNVDVIITDHHTIGKELPEALAIVHTTQLCGAGVGYVLMQELGKKLHQQIPFYHLELVALATVADLVPLTNANRGMLIAGLEYLHKTKRVGILALCDEAKIKPENIDVYYIGHILGPRLNAMGRMESAMDSLRLLCTKDRMRAKVLADKLGNTNKERQLLTQSLAQHAIAHFRAKEKDLKNVLFVANEAYEEGIIGLVAGKLVEEFYRPAIVLSLGEKQSKASARSVSGFDIVTFIRSASDLLINVGGHPMAAGFTVETKKIKELQDFLENAAVQEVGSKLLQRTLKIDCELSLDLINNDLYVLLQTLAPFGMANPEPIFATKGKVVSTKTVGVDARHLKLIIESLDDTKRKFDAIAFGMGEYISELKIGQEITFAYSVDINVWNGKTQLQLKIKDIQSA